MNSFCNVLRIQFVFLHQFGRCTAFPKGIVYTQYFDGQWKISAWHMANRIAEATVQMAFFRRCSVFIKLIQMLHKASLAWKIIETASC